MSHLKSGTLSKTNATRNCVVKPALLCFGRTATRTRSSQLPGSPAARLSITRIFKICVSGPSGKTGEHIN